MTDSRKYPKAPALSKDAPQFIAIDPQHDFVSDLPVAAGVLRTPDLHITWPTHATPASTPSEPLVLGDAPPQPLSPELASAVDFLANRPVFLAGPLKGCAVDARADIEAAHRMLTNAGYLTSFEKSFSTAESLETPNFADLFADGGIPSLSDDVRHVGVGEGTVRELAQMVRPEATDEFFALLRSNAPGASATGATSAAEAPVLEESQTVRNLTRIVRNMTSN